MKTPSVPSVKVKGTLEIAVSDDGKYTSVVSNGVELLSAVGIDKYDIERTVTCPFLHPGRAAELSVDGMTLGIMGEVHPAVLENYEIGTRCYIAQISMDALLKFGMTDKVYSPLPKFPAVTRDLAFVCDKALPVLKLENEITDAVGKILEDISLFDVYEGAQIEKGKKSVAFSLKLRSNEKTLTDEEADAAMKRAIKALEKHGAVLRS